MENQLAEAFKLGRNWYGLYVNGRAPGVNSGNLRARGQAFDRLLLDSNSDRRKEIILHFLRGTNAVANKPNIQEQRFYRLKVLEQKVPDSYKNWEIEVYGSGFPAVSFFFTFKPLYDLLSAESFEYLVGCLRSTELVQELNANGNKRFPVERLVESIDVAYQNRKENKNEYEEN